MNVKSDHRITSFPSYVTKTSHLRHPGEIRDDGETKLSHSRMICDDVIHCVHSAVERPILRPRSAGCPVKSHSSRH